MGRMDIDVEEEAAAFGAIKTALAEGEDAAEASKTVRGQGGEGDDAGKTDGGDAPATTPGAEKSEEEKKAPESEESGEAGEKKDPAAEAAEGAEKKAEGEKQEEVEKAPETPPAKPDYAIRTPVVRGSKRTFDLSDPEQAKQYDAFAQKGMNYELLVEERDADVDRRSTEKLGNFFFERGIVKEGADGKPVLSVEGGVAWLRKAAQEAFGADGVAKLREAFNATLAVADDEDVLSVANIDKELATLDPDLDAGRIADLKRMRALAKKLESVPEQIKTARAPLDERLAAADKAQAESQTASRIAVLDKHLDTELAKYKGFTASKTYSEPSNPADPKSAPVGRLRIIARATRIGQMAQAAGTPKTHEQALAEAAKQEFDAWDADVKAARESSLKEADNLRNQRPEPKKTAPSPGSKGGAGKPSPSKHKVGSPEWTKEQGERLTQIRDGLKA